MVIALSKEAVWAQVFFAFRPYCFVTDVDWHTASPDQLALTVNTWAWFGVYHEPGTIPSRKNG